MTTKRQAHLIVDFVIRWVAKAGQIQGRGRDKTVVFKDLYNVKTGKVTPAVNEIERQVNELLAAALRARDNEIAALRTELANCERDKVAFWKQRDEADEKIEHLTLDLEKEIK